MNHTHTHKHARMHTPWAKAHITHTCMRAHSSIVPKTCVTRSKLQRGEAQRRDDARTQGGDSLWISVYQCVQCQGRVSKNEIYREKGESWQLCQQLINLRVCLYQRGTALICTHTHTHNPAAHYHSTLQSVCPLASHCLWGVGRGSSVQADSEQGNWCRTLFAFSSLGKV